jgi:hypothetical protein
VAPVDPRRFNLDEVAAELGAWCAPRLVAARPVGRIELTLRAVARGTPVSIARHSLPAVRREVGRLLERRAVDLLHAEQLQAFPQTAPSRGRSLPVVLRAQNVESDLWAAAGPGRLLAVQARRLAAWEGQAVAVADLTLAVSAADAERLGSLAAARRGQPRIEVLPPPFPQRLEPQAPALAGAPAVVLLGSSGWPPNRDAVAWFEAEIWPAVRRTLPAAMLHVFGVEAGGGARGRGGAGAEAAARPGEDGIRRHPAPPDSAAAFARGSIHAVPLRFGSGVRMKVLEAWARGVPVVATPEAVAGLAAEDGREVLLARDAASFAGAIGRLHRDPGLAEALAAGGREALRLRHDPRYLARRLIAAYDEVLARRAGAGER